MAGNQNLNSAARAQKDEFYTQRSDIEHELQHYWQHFAGKIVLCNCDDPFESQFFYYFTLNFNLKAREFPRLYRRWDESRFLLTLFL